LIYPDACLLIYLVEHHPVWGEFVATAMAEAGEARFGISPLVKCECLVGPLKRGEPILQRAYTELFGLLGDRPKISEPVLNSVIPAKAGTQVA